MKIPGRMHLLQSKNSWSTGERYPCVRFVEQFHGRPRRSRASTSEHKFVANLLVATILVGPQPRYQTRKPCWLGGYPIKMTGSPRASNFKKEVTQNAGQRDDAANLPHQISENWRRRAWIRALKDAKKISQQRIYDILKKSLIHKSMMPPTTFEATGQENSSRAQVTRVLFIRSAVPAWWLSEGQIVSVKTQRATSKQVARRETLTEASSQHRTRGSPMIHHEALEIWLYLHTTSLEALEIVQERHVHKIEQNQKTPGRR